MPRILIWVAPRQVLIADPRPLIEKPTVAAPHDGIKPRDSERPVGGGPYRLGTLVSTERTRHVNRWETAHPLRSDHNEVSRRARNGLLLQASGTFALRGQKGRMMPPYCTGSASRRSSASRQFCAT